MAVDRSQSSKLREDQIKSNKEENDKRNLHLANYGLVRPGSFKRVFSTVFFLIILNSLAYFKKLLQFVGTLAATGVSKTELDKRQRCEKTKRQKLKNPDMFVSPLRLCIRNMPRAVTDEKLKVFISLLNYKKCHFFVKHYVCCIVNIPPIRTLQCKIF